MPREFKLPDVGEGVHEGELIEWLVEPGDAVTEDMPVAKVETDKALVDVPAPVNGTVRELRFEPGDVVDVGEVLLVFDVEGEPVDPDDSAAADPTPSTDEDSAPPAADSPEAADAASAEDAGGRVFAAPSARRLARELGVDIESIEGSGPGGRVTEQDVETAAQVDTESGPADPAADADADDGAGSGAADPASGAAAAVADDDPTADIEAMLENGIADADGAQEGSDADGEATATTAEPAERERTLATPATRRIAAEEGVDIDAVPAVEERDGEAVVTEEAVREYAAAQREAQAADAAAVSESAEAGAGGAEAGTEAASAAREETTPAAGGEKPERREPYRGVRRSIGEAMAESKYTAPHVTHHDECDVTALVETKERLAERAEERGIRLTYMPFVLKAVTAALKEHPQMNAALDEDAEEIVYKEYYDLGVATATDAGLMVPVIEGVDRKGLLQLASELSEVVEKARNRTISPEELRGSTFSVTNVGAIGGEYATPILNPPEVGIIALGEIRRKPRVVVDDSTVEVRPSGARPGSGGERSEPAGESIEPRSVLPLSLTIDHRVVDGAIAARFTNTVMEYLESPELLLLE